MYIFVQIGVCHCSHEYNDDNFFLDIKQIMKNFQKFFKNFNNEYIVYCVFSFTIVEVLYENNICSNN